MMSEKAEAAAHLLDDVRVEVQPGKTHVVRGSYRPLFYLHATLLLFLSVMLLAFLLPDFTVNTGNAAKEFNALSNKPAYVGCADTCRLTLVESIPENLTYPAGSPTHLSVYEGWMNLLKLANESIDIASSYWNLRGKDAWSDPTDWQGENIYKELQNAGLSRGIKIRIAQSKPNKGQPDLDTQDLMAMGAASVRSIDMPRLVGAGILHTKMWLVDKKHFYVGSANLDWRSLTQVKELGAMVYDCPCLANDMAKIFEVYWYLGNPDATIPKKWPASLATSFNADHPLAGTFNGTMTQTYLSSSPPPLCTTGRSSDIDSILDAISKAKKFIYIAVMDYFPLTIYTHPERFWPVIDDALRRAAIDRKVHVRVMGSWWKHSRPYITNVLLSLSALNGVKGAKVETKLFHVPAFSKRQARIPFARVNHNKYMVTDNAAFIGTSNWSGDYFISTGGIGFLVNQTQSGTDPFRKQLLAVFQRDWTSSYAKVPY